MSSAISSLTNSFNPAARLLDQAQASLQGQLSFGRVVTAENKDYKLNPENNRLEAINIRVELYAVGFFGHETSLGGTTTDLLGNFLISYNNPAPAFYSKLIGMPKLILKVVETKPAFPEHPVEQLQHFNQPYVMETINTGLRANNSLQDLGLYELTYAQSPVALDKQKATPEFLQQTYGYKFRLIAAVLPELISKLITLLFQPIMPSSFIQMVYNASLINRYQKKELTSVSFIEELKNEICATEYQQTASHVTWTATWDQYDFDDNSAISLPNVTVVAKKEPGGIVLESIKIKIKNNDEVVITPNDSAQDLNNAIFIARSVFCIKGEAAIHLAEGHLVPGIIADNFYSFITRSNPLFDLINPFLQGLPSINELGSKGIIFGKGSILESTVLSENSTTRVITDSMEARANLNKNFLPQPVDETHKRAKHALGFHNCYFNFFTKFITDNSATFNSEGIRKELFQFSRAVNNHWAKIPVIFDENASLTSGENLTSFATFFANVVNLATFLHWSAHSRQALLTHADQATLGLKLTSFNKGDTLPTYGNADKSTISTQLLLSRTLLNFKDISLLKNESGQINGELIAAIRGYTSQFPDDYDWENMSQGTAI